MLFDKRLLILVGIPLIAFLAMFAHGPIAQWEHYHDFADRRAWLGIANAADVLSNLGFLVVGLLGLHLTRQRRRQTPSAALAAGFSLFFLSLILTAFGSAWYHLAPDNSRLVWDRIPIALACVGLLDAAIELQLGSFIARRLRYLLWIVAPLSVVWWRWTDIQGIGDLRLYLLVQGLPLVMIPLLLTLYPSTARQRWGFGIAILLYIAAKIFESADHAILAQLQIVSGHTLKHLFATLAAASIYAMLKRIEYKASQKQPGGLKSLSL